MGLQIMSAQIVFDPGYFIDNSGNRVECFIRYRQSTFTPTDFKYKRTQESAVETGVMDEVEEFGVTNYALYVRKTVLIDTSSQNLTTISDHPEPELQTRTVFLEALVSGLATLYKYVDKQRVFFFFEKTDTGLQQLIFKQYQKTPTALGTNEGYKQQLFEHVYCEQIPLTDITNMRYREKEVKAYFLKYNSCLSDEATDIQSGTHKTQLHLTAREGVSVADMHLIRPNYSIDFLPQLSFRPGFEFALSPPVNKGKWELTAEPIFQYFTSETRTINEGKANYYSLEVPLGIRYYMYLNNGARFFTNINYSIDFPFTSNVEIYSLFYRIRSRPKGLPTNVGIGFDVNQRLQFEFRAGRRKILDNYFVYPPHYRTLSFIVGYRLF